MASTTGRGLSVRTKLIGLAVGTSVLALLLACGSFVYYDRSSFAAAKQSTLSVLVGSVAQSAFGPTAFQDGESAAVILRVLEAEPSARAGAIYLPTGERLALWSRPGAVQVVPATWAGKYGGDGYHDRALQLTKVITNPEQQAVGTLHVVFSTADLDARTERFLQLALLVLVVSAGAALVLAMFAQRVLTRPVQILSEAAHRVEVERNLDVRAERVSNDELGRLTDAFNGMLDMIKARDAELAAHRAGLEQIVAERTRDLDARNGEMRLVLDHVDQGMVILSRAGVLSNERSAILQRWFGTAEPGATLWSLLAPSSESVASALAMGWGQLLDGWLPIEVCLAQLPQRFQDGSARHFELAYLPIVAPDGSLDKLLVLISDVTARVERERSDATQAETMALFGQISTDRTGFQDFLEETQATMRRLLSEQERDVTEVLRELHTLKGNFGLFGLRSMAELVHHIEDECLPERRAPSATHRAQLQAAWESLEGRARGFLGEGGRGVTVEQGELEELRKAIDTRASHEELARLANRIGLAPVTPKLWRIGESARRLASRLGKDGAEVVVEADGVKASASLAWLWQVLPHVVANAVDHGLENADERSQANKSGPARLTLRAQERTGALIVEIADNGRGIAWERLLGRARQLGLPANDNQDAVRALFTDGVSARDEATITSGRGIGMAAVKAACDAHGARVLLSSTPGQGTTFRFELREAAGIGYTPSVVRLSMMAAI
jgi:HAMP domain-containing protein/HPt (histidine-containing phosphotransfer) domain-containing protein